MTLEKDDATAKETSKSVGIMLETKKGNLILVRLRTNLLSPVAGRLKIGEDFYDGLIRELKEESGLNINQLSNINIKRSVLVLSDNKDRLGTVYQATVNLSEEEILTSNPTDTMEVSHLEILTPMEVLDLLTERPHELHRPEFNKTNLSGWVAEKLINERLIKRDRVLKERLKRFLSMKPFMNLF